MDASGNFASSSRCFPKHPTSAADLKLGPEVIDGKVSHRLHGAHDKADVANEEHEEHCRLFLHNGAGRLAGLSRLRIIFAVPEKPPVQQGRVDLGDPGRCKGRDEVQKRPDARDESGQD